MGIFTWLGSRALNKTIAKINESQAEMNFAQADSTSADYAEKIIKQADERVTQALADKERSMTERDAAYTEAKAQRKAKQEWRDKYFDEQKAHITTQLELKDTQGRLSEEAWHRCETNGCANRIPPRSRTEKTEDHADIQ
jgi:microcompartment protein CcmL/EutN